VDLLRKSPLLLLALIFTGICAIVLVPLGWIFGRGVEEGDG